MAKKRVIFYTLGDYEVGRRPPVPSKAEEDDEVMHGRMNPKAAKKRATLSSLQAVAKKFKATKPKTAPFPFNRDYRKRKRPL